MSIEQKISELLAESKVADEVQLEEPVEEPVEVLDEEVVGIGALLHAKKGFTPHAIESAHKKEEDDTVGLPVGNKYGVRAQNHFEGVQQIASAHPNNPHGIAAVKAMEEFHHHAANHAAGNNPDPKDPNNPDYIEHQAKVVHDHLQKFHDSINNAKSVKEQVEDVKLDISEDLFALTNGEDLSEEFKTKAAVIFEAAIVSRVKQEVAKLEEAFEARLAKVAEENQEGLVEKIDGYLNYVVETWIAQNEIALESGMKSEILENFVSGLKGLFEEHYIDIPDEKYDVLSSLGTTIEELEAKLDEQVAANVEMHKIISEAARVDIIKDACVGLTDTEVEKFTDLAEELKFEDSESFSGKVQTIRENYFTTKATNKSIDSVVTDEPITLNEEKYVSPQMAAYVAAIKNLK